MKDFVTRLLLVYIGAVILLFLLLFMCASCEVLKTKQDKKEEMVAETKVDSAFVKKTESNSVTDWDYWKTTLQFMQQPKGGDTIINKNYYSTTPQPQVIIMEGGKGKSETTVKSIDSGFYKRLDKMEQMIEESSKTKETKPAKMTQLILIGLGLVIVAVVLSKLRMSIK